MSPARVPAVPLNAAATAALIACLLLGGPGRAEDLFSVTATETVGFGGPDSGSPFEVSADDLPSLFEDAVEARDLFGEFAGDDARFTFSYAQVEEALVVTVNADNNQATLDIPGIDFSRTFNATNRGELEDEITDFLEDDGSDVYADFLAFLREETLVNVIDGNPNSATALVGAQAFRDFATPGLNSVDGVGHRFDLAGDRSGYFKIGGAASTFDADGFEGDDYRVHLSAGVDLTKQVSLAWASTANFRDIEGTRYYAGGGTLAAPITVWSSLWGEADRPDDAPEQGSGWPTMTARLTPLVQMGVGGSIDAADGGLFWGYGGSGAFMMDFDRFRLNAGAQVVTYRGLDVGIDDYEFATDLDQTLLSVGLHSAVDLGNAFTVDAGVSFHDYLDDAATDNWVTPSVGLAWAPDETTLRVGYSGDFGDGFDAHRLTLDLVLSF